MNRLAKRIERIAAELSNGNADFNDFFDSFISNILENDKINGDTLEVLVHRHLSSANWVVYGNERRRNLIALKVKGYGLGDFNKFNKDGRAEGFEDGYYSEIQNSVEDFYNAWNENFKAKFNIPLEVAGRSSGYWGVDVMDYKNFYDIFTINKGAIIELFNKMKAANDYEESAWDLGYDACLNLEYGEDVANYIDFNPNFISFLKEFEKSVKETSAEWETQEWNDMLFDSFEI